MNYLYDPLHPAVLTLIKTTIDAGLKVGIPVTLCGEMAGDARFVRLLMGLGLTEFSMPPNLILETKRNLIACRRTTLKKQVNAMLAAQTTDERQSILDKINASAPDH